MNSFKIDLHRKNSFAEILKNFAEYTDLEILLLNYSNNYV